MFDKDNSISISADITIPKIILFAILALVTYMLDMLLLAVILAVIIFLKVKLEEGTLLVTLAPQMYTEFLQVLVGLRKAVSLLDGAEKLRIERDQLEAKLYTMALEMAAEKEKIRLLYEAKARGEITESELKEKIEQILEEKLKKLKEEEKGGEEEDVIPEHS